MVKRVIKASDFMQVRGLKLWCSREKFTQPNCKFTCTNDRVYLNSVAIFILRSRRKIEENNSVYVTAGVGHSDAHRRLTIDFE